MFVVYCGMQQVSSWCFLFNLEDKLPGFLVEGAHGFSFAIFFCLIAFRVDLCLIDGIRRN